MAYVKPIAANLILICFLLLASCSEDDMDNGIFDDDDGIEGTNGGSGTSDDTNSNTDDNSGTNTLPVFLIIDEESIDNGNEPNNFSETDVNDHLARIGLRDQLDYFKNNVGETIELYTGQVGDEGWHAPKTILDSWINAGPTDNGLRNYLYPGPGLGGGDDDPEVLLDEIPNVIPLRATALAMLQGQTVYALVYDSDVSTNYDPIQANLQGDNLGLIAFKVLEVTKRNDGSDSDLPRVKITILDADDYTSGTLYLFNNAPEPFSSSEPEDIDPPANYDDIELLEVN